MGSIVFNGMRIRDSKPHGLLPVSDILAESSDVGAIKIGLRLGDDRFYKYIHDFGFGQTTGIELPGETRGLTKPPNRWSKVSIAAISMGQEIGITPLQLTGLISTMANDGVWVAPRIVAATTEPQSTPQMIAFHPTGERRVISSLTAAQMRQMMQGVVLHGTGKKALLLGYTTAGKTGTAQKVDPATHAYSHTKYVGSFAGFAPINNPAIVVAVILDSAVGLHQGGQVAAPVFQHVTQQVLEYLHTPHDVELPPNRQVLLAQRKVKDQDLEEGSPDHLGESIELAEAGILDSTGTPAVAAAKPSPEIVANGVVPATLREREPIPASASTQPPPIAVETTSDNASAVPPSRSNGTVVLDVEQGGIVVPSFVGKSVRAAIEMAQEFGLDLDAIGSGVARVQSPAPGAHVAAGARVTVRFER
jgi:cell division protein FtsI (penicillin-binding protein 3)